MLTENTANVYISNIPVNYQQSQAADKNLNEQLIRTIHTEGAIVYFDSRNSKYSTNGYEINIDTGFRHNNRIRLDNLYMNYNYPNINKNNKNVIIKYKNLTTLTEGEINFNLDEGYHNNFTTFMTVLENAINVAADLLTSDNIHWGERILLQNPKKRFIIERGSNVIINVDYNKYKLISPFLIGNDYEFYFDEKCSFIKCGKSFSYFSPNKKMTLNPSVVTLPATNKDKNIISNVVNLIYSRFLVVCSNELTLAQRMESYDGKRSRRDMVTIIALKDSSFTGPSYQVLSTQSTYVILARGIELKNIFFSVYDEHDNLIPFGYDRDGELLDNQLTLCFITHR